MALSPGSRLGPYEVTALLGEGGMGQVYRATDSNLKRQVAIKVLPASVAGDADRLARFQREAEVLAALNHPHIAAIYGLEKTAEFTALVMELVEGEDLSQRIARGAIPLDEALPIAKQIAEALEAAHEQGIIHRDLKPANIKLRSDGTVKVLDFGLAKAMDPAASSSTEAMNSPTLSMHATQAGIILGTAAYMSPEQASGKPVDKRADVWSFGVVLVEMLTGQRLFDGETVSHTLADVLRGPIDFGRLPADTPTAIRDLLRRCLTRDVKKRMRDIGDARIAIDEVLTAPADTLGATAAGARPLVPSRSATLPWFVAVAALLAAGVMLTLWAPWRVEPPADRPLVRLDVDLGADVSLPAPSTAGSSVVISPDGTRLVYASGTPPRLFIRRLDQPNAVELPGTQGATSPFFSPDGQWVGFATDRGASKISVEGGAVVPLGDAAVRGASWDADGSIVVGAGGELLRMSAAGASESLAKTGDGELLLLQPQILPGGRAILFTADNPGDVDRTTIQVLTLADGRKKTVIRGGASGRYLATADGAGHLVYVNKTTLFAVPFDVTTLETRGAAVPVVDDLASEGLIGVGQFDVSGTGTLIYRRASGSGSGLTTLQWVDSAGAREPLRAAPGNYTALRISPDGTRLALGVSGQQGREVWTYDPQRDVRTRLTASEDHMSPVWSPDGRHVVFGRVTGGVFLARADGARQPQALIPSKLLLYPSSFTPDGRRLAYSELVITGRQQIWTVPIEDRGGELHAGTPEPFLKSQFADTAPAFSPDGRWLAYQSNESGTPEVYVRPFPPPASGQGSRWQVSNSGGTAPRWSRNGRELMYQAGDSIMAVSYAVSGDAFVADRPRAWIAALGGTTNTPNGWDMAPDGKRALVVTPVEGAEATKAEHHVVFLQNFFDELRRRVPLGK